MRVLCSAMAVTIIGLASYSSTASWKLAIDANLTLTQNAYSDNWVGGEVGAGSWTFGSNFLAEKQLHAKIHNKNTLKLLFGQTYNQDEETKSWSKPVKSTDLIDFEWIFRMTLGGFVDPFMAGRMETQFLDVSDPAKNRYINPVRFTESFGVAKVLIKEENREWTARMGGGLRQYIDRDVLVVPVDPGWYPPALHRQTQTSNDGGIEFVTDFKTPLAQERITFASKLTLFQALFYSEADKFKGLPSEDYWKSMDVNWENIFTASVTKYLMVNLYVQLLYDKEIDLGARFKRTLALGLTYKSI